MEYIVLFCTGKKQQLKKRQINWLDWLIWNLVHPSTPTNAKLWPGNFSTTWYHYILVWCAPVLAVLAILYILLPLLVLYLFYLSWYIAVTPCATHAIGESWPFGWENLFRPKKHLKTSISRRQIWASPHFGKIWRPNCWHQVNFWGTPEKFGV